MIEQSSFLAKGFCLFPELLGNSPDKFNRFALWLATKQSIVCPNIRDQFTAGGQGEIEYNERIYVGIPRMIISLSNNLVDIKSTLNHIDIAIIEEYWGCKANPSQLYEDWCNLVIPYLNKISSSDFPIEDYIRSK